MGNSLTMDDRSIKREDRQPVSERKILCSRGFVSYNIEWYSKSRPTVLMVVV